MERRGSVLVSSPAWHAGDLGSILGPGVLITNNTLGPRIKLILLGVKTWLSTLETVYLCLCLSMKTLTV